MADFDFNPTTGLLDLVNADAPTDATYLTLSTNATLTNERVATASSNVTITDAGAGSTATFDLSNSGVSAATYGALNTLPIIAVDAKGRITSASNSAIAFPTPGFDYGTITGTSGSSSAASTTANLGFATSNGMSLVASTSFPGSIITINTPQDLQTSATPTFVNAVFSSRTSTRVAYFGIGGTLTDDADFTFNGTRLALATTGSSGGISIGGDALLYRSATAVLSTNATQLQVIPASFTATSGSMRSLYSEAIFNPSGATSGRAWGYVFYAEARSANNFTDATSCIVGVEGTVVNNSTGTLSAMSCGIFFNALGANSTTTRFTGLDVYGADVSGSAGTGATVTDAAGLLLRMGRSSGNTSLGNITSFWGVQHRASTWSGTGHMTSQYGMAYYTGHTMNSVTANNQVRKYVEVPAMPTPGAFTGTTIYGIDFLGTSRAVRDGIRIAADDEAVLYSSAADTLATVGSFVANESGGDFDFRVEGDSLTHMIYTDANAASENIALLAGGVPAWNAMDGGIFIANATTVPTGNPTAGGYLYVNAGALTYRGSGGTVTVLGAA